MTSAPADRHASRPAMNAAARPWLRVKRDDLIDPVLARNLDGTVAAAVVDNQPLDCVEPGDLARQRSARRPPGAFFVEARDLNDELHVLAAPGGAIFSNGSKDLASEYGGGSPQKATGTQRPRGERRPPSFRARAPTGAQGTLLRAPGDVAAIVRKSRTTPETAKLLGRLNRGRVRWGSVVPCRARAGGKQRDACRQPLHSIHRRRQLSSAGPQDAQALQGRGRLLCTASG